MSIISISPDVFDPSIIVFIVALLREEKNETQDAFVSGFRMGDASVIPAGGTARVSYISLAIASCLICSDCDRPASETPASFKTSAGPETPHRVRVANQD